MDYAIKKLKQDEIVLMKKIKSLQDGKPKWAASKQLDEIRSAIALLERYNDMTEQDLENEDEYLKQIFELHPAKAKAQSDYLNKNKFSSINNSNIMNTHSIDIEKYNSIEEQRNKTMGDNQFIQWCKQYNIGSRVEVVSEQRLKANELMQQYTKYTNWISKRNQIWFSNDSYFNLTKSS